MTQFHDMPDGRRIAFRIVEGPETDEAPAIVFLPGYMSDMAGSKATALFDWAKGEGRTCLLLDYSGCGESDGDFADGTLSRWRDEVLALIEAKLDGPVVLVGSSMGGWLMLLVGLALADRLAGMVGIAAAPDFSDWGYSDAQKAQLAAGETVLEASPYGPEPTPTHAGFWADAQEHHLLGGPIPITCPVTLLHGQADADVPWEISLRLADKLASHSVLLQLTKHGDHRLSRPEDVARLIAAVDSHLSTP